MPEECGSALPEQTQFCRGPRQCAFCQNKPNLGLPRHQAAVVRADTTPGKIDKSVLTISEPRRLRDKAHLKFVSAHGKQQICD